ncbi:hypothetical protein CK203_082738 [Vitis vinifera]|uniref:Uncharacterized protein n=1 Tax=Vitis vinifera TaxID=29760 RepID=A0A438FA19_VITVI|nr:hypothetical protein CK203_082738 [Vitis vinifera]
MELSLVPGFPASSFQRGTYQICYASHWCYSRVIGTDRVHLMSYWGILPSFSPGGDRSLTYPLQFPSLEPSSVFQTDVQSRVLGFGVQSRYHFSASSFRHSESSSFFRLTFRVASSVSAFRVVITSQFDVQKSLSLLSSTFRVIIILPQFRRSEPSSVFRSAFRVVITSQLRCSEPSSLLLSVSASRASVFRSTFRVTSSVSAFRVVITSQFDVQSHHHPSSVSAFRAVIGFQIGVQSRYHFSASVFRAIITTSLSFGVQSHHRFSDRHSESHPQFQRSESLSSQLRCSELSSSFLSFGVQSRHRFSDRRSESLSLLSFDVQSHHHYFSQFRRSEPSSVFRSTFRVAFSVSAFRVVITSQLRCSEPSSLLLLVSTFRAVIGFQIDIQSRILKPLFPSLVFRVGLVIQSHNSWRPYPLALRILPSWFYIVPRSFLTPLSWWFDRYSSLTLISWVTFRDILERDWVLSVASEEL